MYEKRHVEIDCGSIYLDDEVIAKDNVCAINGNSPQLRNNINYKHCLIKILATSRCLKSRISFAFVTSRNQSSRPNTKHIVLLHIWKSLGSKLTLTGFSLVILVTWSLLSVTLWYVQLTWSLILQRETSGAIHSTKISGLRFENFLVSNGSRQVRTVSFHSTRKTSFALI